MLERGKKQSRKKSKAPAAAPRPEASALPAPRVPTISPEERRRMISDAAYFRAQRRGFRGGDAGRDWVEAEAEIDAMLLNRR